jgi:hypothetical protein
MNRIFSKETLAKEHLQDFTDKMGEPCCVYRHNKEYSLQPISDMVDPKSTRIVMRARPVKKKNKHIDKFWHGCNN